MLASHDLTAAASPRKPALTVHLILAGDTHEIEYQWLADVTADVALNGLLTAGAASVILYRDGMRLTGRPITSVAGLREALESKAVCR